MVIEVSGAGETLAAIVVSDELSNQHDANNNIEQNAESHKNCANCGETLTGAFCHACGQSSHIHRSILHLFEEALHGILHFDTKAWRTIPALIFRPGQLTKQYIDGKRTSFVSPLAMFLFLIFLMFFIFSYTMNGPSAKDINNPEGERSEVVKELKDAQLSLAQKLAQQAKQQLKPDAFQESKQKSKQESKPESQPIAQPITLSTDAIELKADINAAQLEVRDLQNTLDSIDGKEPSLPELNQALTKAEKNLIDAKQTQRNFKPMAEDASNPDSTAFLQSLDIAQNVRFAESEVAYLKKQIAAEMKDQAKKKAQAKQKTQAKQGTKDEGNEKSVVTHKSGYTNYSDVPFLNERIKHAVENPDLTLFKMKKNSSGLAFLLIPLSLPFLWLLFAFRRQFVMFDHTVFALYSLSFMCLLMCLLAILAKFELKVIASLLFVFIPPVHMFSQLRNAYNLTKFETLWRTLVLIFIALFSLVLFATIVTVASV